MARCSQAILGLLLGVIQDMYLDDTHKGREVFSEVESTIGGGMVHMSYTTRSTSLVECLLVQVGRGLEPRPVEGGHLGGAGSQ
jgi:hypothetical protein